MDNRERDPMHEVYIYARGSMLRAWEEEEADARIIVKSSKMY